MIWLLTSFLVSVELSLSTYAQKASVSILSETEEVYKHEDPSGVLGANETVHLLQTSYYWNLYATRCMKSRFGKVLGKSFVRSVEYWGLDTSSHAPKFRKFVMILKLTIHNNGRHQPFLHVERLDKRGISQRGRYRSSRHGNIEISSWDYPILFADTVCVLTGAYEDGGTGSRACTLWVKESSLASPPTHCKFLLMAMCSTSAYNAYNSEKPYCDVYGLRRPVKPR
ncbi:uncharacterized protein LOC144134768 isoform X2 [Amblyomma americanum]